MIFNPPSRVPPHPTTRYAFPYLCWVYRSPPRTQEYYDTLDTYWKNFWKSVSIKEGCGMSIDDIVSSQPMTAVSKLLIKEKE